jgi:hypothetical protein
MTSRLDDEEYVDPESSLARRDFIKGVGKFATVTPAAVTMLLEVSMNSPAVAASGGKPGHGYGDTNHTHSGPPGQNKQP